MDVRTVVVIENIISKNVSIYYSKRQRRYVST